MFFDYSSMGKTKIVETVMVRGVLGNRLYDQFADVIKRCQLKTESSELFLLIYMQNTPDALPLSCALAQTPILTCSYIRVDQQYKKHSIWFERVGLWARVGPAERRAGRFLRGQVLNWQDKVGWPGC